jgi:hypothetical protein
VEILS